MSKRFAPSRLPSWYRLLLLTDWLPNRYLFNGIFLLCWFKSNHVCCFVFILHETVKIGTAFRAAVIVPLFFFLQSGKLNVNNVCESINNSMKSLNAELNCSILLWETRQSKCFAICSPPISRQFSHILRFTGLVSPATVWWIIYESHTAAEKPQMNVIVFSETLWAHLQVINPLK